LTGPSKLPQCASIYPAQHRGVVCWFSLHDLGWPHTGIAQGWFVLANGKIGRGGLPQDNADPEHRKKPSSALQPNCEITDKVFFCFSGALTGFL